jgi:hypothetical protein
MSGKLVGQERNSEITDYATRLYESLLADATRRWEKTTVVPKTLSKA